MITPSWCQKISWFCTTKKHTGSTERSLFAHLLFVKLAEVLQWISKPFVNIRIIYSFKIIIISREPPAETMGIIRTATLFFSYMMRCVEKYCKYNKIFKYKCMWSMYLSIFTSKNIFRETLQDMEWKWIKRAKGNIKVVGVVCKILLLICC